MAYVAHITVNSLLLNCGSRRYSYPSQKLIKVLRRKFKYESKPEFRGKCFLEGMGGGPNQKKPLG